MIALLCILLLALPVSAEIVFEEDFEASLDLTTRWWIIQEDSLDWEVADGVLRIFGTTPSTSPNPVANHVGIVSRDEYYPYQPANCSVTVDLKMAEGVVGYASGPSLWINFHVCNLSDGFEDYNTTLLYGWQSIFGEGWRLRLQTAGGVVNPVPIDPPTGNEGDWQHLKMLFLDGWQTCYVDNVQMGPPVYNPFTNRQIELKVNVHERDHTIEVLYDNLKLWSIDNSTGVRSSRIIPTSWGNVKSLFR